MWWGKGCFVQSQGQLGQMPLAGVARPDEVAMGFPRWAEVIPGMWSETGEASLVCERDSNLNGSHAQNLMVRAEAGE